MRPRTPDKAKLVVSVIGQSEELISSVIALLKEKYGEADYVSRLMDFDLTGYYEEEMGRGLKRKFVSFVENVEHDELPGIKLFTNSIEMDLSPDGNRRVNVDPGILTLHNFTLASCKNFSHRIYMGQGVYGDLTLLYSAKDRDYVKLPWTYMDYAATEVRGMLVELRSAYAKGLKDGKD